MKGFSMNKVLGTIKKRNTSNSEGGIVDPANESPEETAARCVKSFCESRGSSTGDDVIFLPAIVEAAVASPAAATEAARLIRKFLARDYWSKPSCQYNAIMLIRILCDNPGPGFTRNIDKKFVDTCKELLRSGRDVSVRQMLMETLDSFENTKAYDEGLALVIEMWRKEKEKAYKAYGGTSSSAPRVVVAPPFQPNQQQPGFPPQQQQQYQHQPHHSSRKQLPDPVELANRLEEARTSAKLLEQVVACTPPAEVLSNELIKEFSDRCTGASRSVQGYMAVENPAPDNDTMESLIDTNEQLQQALNHHRRAVLQAKKHLGLDSGNDRASMTPSPGGANGGGLGVGGPPPPISQQQQPYNFQGPPPPAATRKPIGSGQGGNGFGVPGGAGFGAGSGSSSRNNSNGKGKASASLNAEVEQSSSSAYGMSSAAAGPSRSATVTPHRDSSEAEDPFRDPPAQDKSGSSADRRHGGGGSTSDDTPRLPYEPYHPGFMGSSAFSSSSANNDDGGNKSKKPSEFEPVTPVSDDDDATDRRYRAAAAAPPTGDHHLDPPAKDSGPLYRY